MHSASHMSLELVSATICAAEDVSAGSSLVPLEGDCVVEADADAIVPVPALVPVAAAWQTFNPNVAAVNSWLLEDRAEEQILFVSC